VKVARTRTRRVVFFFVVFVLARRGTVEGGGVVRAVVVGAAVVDVVLVDEGVGRAGEAPWWRAGLAPKVNDPMAAATSALDATISAAVRHDFG
jgi:hypothetical protein